jgi:hypothetical protein
LGIFLIFLALLLAVEIIFYSIPEMFCGPVAGTKFLLNDLSFDNYYQKLSKTSRRVRFGSKIFLACRPSSIKVKKKNGTPRLDKSENATAISSRAGMVETTISAQIHIRTLQDHP